MATILTGLPKDKSDDYRICRDFQMTTDKKIICGSSTMKVYCRELGITPEIKITMIDGLPQAEYKIAGIDLALEGAISLNDCYLALTKNKIKNENINNFAQILKDSTSVFFLVSTAPTKDLDLYKTKNIIPRKEIVIKIAEYLESKNIATIIKYL